MIPFARFFRPRFLLVATLFATPSLVLAQNTWKGRDGDWDEAKNWSKNALPPLKIVPPVKKAPANAKPPSSVKPSAPTPTPTKAAAADIAVKAPALPAPTTLATPNAVIIGAGTSTWHADRQGDFSVEIPVLMTKKGGWKQTGGPSWIFVRNGGSLTITDATFDGGTSANFIVGSDTPGHVLMNGADSVLTLPAGELKLRRNATFTLQAGNVFAELVSFDDAAEGTHGVLTLAGGTLTLSGNAYGGVYGGGEHHYINFPPGSKAVILLTAIESDAAYEQLEKGGIRFNNRIDLNAFKIEPREGSGTKITLDPAAKP
ncbi:hypothetical protein [Rariglobus hedericola]|uniref:G8 domain-containing protein n=1 Tax=Rariglobus hedericola TaxID=2597822 RepID=A0A556QJ01_9BACT|nr:hypothetical protein [Rariglobus hedericola]TSJ76635.1 hypothetical protein FPL22_10925 [Rariglobus hedericola]